MEIGPEQLGDKVAGCVSGRSENKQMGNLHVLQWGDENVAQTDNLDCCQELSALQHEVLSVRSRVLGA